MKKFLTAFTLIALFLGAVPAFASTANVSTVTTEMQASKTEATRIEQRLNEIRKMDLKNMSASDKKLLRNEVLGMKKKTGPTGGVYISGGALILIIILLIILF